MTFSFIIPICIRCDNHSNQLNRCINSIRSFYPNNNIYLINDSDDNFIIDNIISTHYNIIIINTIKKGSADQQVFKIIIDYNITEKCLIIQDSMILNC